MTTRDGQTETLKGIGVAPGIGVGTAAVWRKEKPQVTERLIAPDAVQAEVERLTHAVDAAKQQIEQLRTATVARVGEAEAQVFDAHLSFLADPAYVGEMRKRIEQRQQNAEFVCSQVTEETRQMLASLPNEYMQARADDIRDVGTRLLACLSGGSGMDLATLPAGTVLVVHELVPSDVSSLSEHVSGLVTAVGSKTAHAAIIARTLGIPAVFGIGEALVNITDGVALIVDGTQGTVTVNPDADTLEQARSASVAERAAKEAARQRAGEASTTKDGRRIDVFANIGGPQDISSALENGADGVGLFRTEFLYLENDHWPTEEEQFAAYQQVLSAFGERPVVIRTLDIGGDKELPYANLPQEDNPFLGLRAIRYCLAEPEVFKTQLRALLRASVHGTLWIMFPMVDNLAEVRAARALLEECRTALESEGHSVRADIPVGIMVETPAAAVTADILSREVDFFSIGTNDLTQYTLAADRGNPAVTELYDATHPAVLRLIRMTCEAAERAGIPVGMCGEFAGDAKMTELLVGLGLQELSMSASFVPGVKESVRKTDSQAARSMALQVLEHSNVENQR